MQRGTINAPVAATEGAEAQPSTVGPWGVAADPVNLPEPRSDAAGFTANGALYLVGGADDAEALHSELYWSIPTASGSIPEWKHLAKSDLPTGGLAGAAPVVLGGRTRSWSADARAMAASSTRAPGRTWPPSRRSSSSASLGVTSRA